MSNKRVKNFYEVAVGAEIGILESWALVKDTIHGYSGNKHLHESYGFKKVALHHMLLISTAKDFISRINQKKR